MLNLDECYTKLYLEAHMNFYHIYKVVIKNMCKNDLSTARLPEIHTPFLQQKVNELQALVQRDVFSISSVTKKEIQKLYTWRMKSNRDFKSNVKILPNRFVSTIYLVGKQKLVLLLKP